MPWVLIAFSGSIVDKNEEHTEVEMNKIQEKELPEKFHSDDYQVLIVAEKYQTGFDTDSILKQTINPLSKSNTFDEFR